MATLTASAAHSNTDNQPNLIQARFNTTGLIQAVSRYSSSATLATGDVVEMVKVPAGAVIHDIQLGYEGIFHDGTGTEALAIGTADDDDMFASADLLSARTGAHVVRMDNNHGYEFSAADTIDVKIFGATGESRTSLMTWVLSAAYSCNIPSFIGGGGTSEGANATE